MSRLRSIGWRRAAAALAFALVVIGGFEPHYLRVIVADAEAAEGILRELPYQKLPGYRHLMIEAAKRIPEGSLVAFWMPSPRWNEGYEYGYYRSGYLLAGRQIVPLIDPADRFYPEHAARADWVVCWRCDTPFPKFETVWKSRWGSLAKRT